jgi:hypothetical protein
MEQLDSRWTDFREVYYLSIFRISVGKIQVSWKSYKNNCHFILICSYIYDNVLLILSYDKRWSCWFCLMIRDVSDKSCRETQKNILCSMRFFKIENCAVYETVWGNTVRTDSIIRHDVLAYRLTRQEYRYTFIISNSLFIPFRRQACLC